MGKREVINEVQESERDLLEGYNPNLHGEIRRERSGTQSCALFPHARVSGERTREQTTRETLSQGCVGAKQAQILEDTEETYHLSEVHHEAVEETGTG